VAVQLVPLVYVALLAWRCYPPEGHQFLDDVYVAEQLGLNLSADGGVLLAGYSKAGVNEFKLVTLTNNFFYK
jgi:hypothetical protein